MRKLFMWLLGFLKNQFGPRESTEGLIRRVFPGDDQSCAVEFYRSWAGEPVFGVELGSGVGDYPAVRTVGAERFYQDAGFFFYSKPIEFEDYCVLGWDDEDDLHGVSLDKRSGKVHLLFENDQELVLADSFRDFLARLRQAGCEFRASSGSSGDSIHNS
ncbi:MAG: hypothetical protein ACYC35_30265 [Pirellulales bacterium]